MCAVKKARLILILMFGASRFCLAQVGGGSVYNQDRSGGALGAERAKRILAKEEMPPSATSMFVDASVLMNVKADEYVAIFGVSQEGDTLEDARQKTDSVIGRFSADLKQLGVMPKDLYVDFVAQNRIYGYEIAGDVAKEKVTGFEVKKNVAVHFRSEPLLEQYVAAASRSGIFDLIKVDYIVKDIGSIHSKLMEQAVRVIGQKIANHERLLGIKLRQQPQIYAERYASYYPPEMYNSYVAQEAEDVSGGYNRQRFTVQGARKARTFYFDALNGKTFDSVVNPIVVEPVVQFTLYLKVKYETGKTEPGAIRGATRPAKR